MKNLITLSPVICVLILAYMESFAYGADLGETCTDDSNCTTNAHCSSSSHICECETSHYKSNSTECSPMLDHGDTCELDIACVGDHAKCRNKKCDCLDSYYYKQSCVERIKINQPCVVADKSCIQNAVCNSTTTKCDCLESFLYDNSTQSCLKSGTVMITFEFFVVMLAMAVFLGINNEFLV